MPGDKTPPGRAVTRIALRCQRSIESSNCYPGGDANPNNSSLAVPLSPVICCIARGESAAIARSYPQQTCARRAEMACAIDLQRLPTSRA